MVGICCFGGILLVWCLRFVGFSLCLFVVFCVFVVVLFCGEFCCCFFVYGGFAICLRIVVWC